MGFVRAKFHREPDELPRISERLEVQQDDVGLCVVGPVLQEIVTTDIGLVAGRDELRDADAEIAGPAHHLDAQPARLRQEGDVPRDRSRRRERGVHVDCRRGVHDAETVRPDEPHAVATCQRNQLPFGGLAVGAFFGKPGGNHDESPHSLLRALPDDVEHLGRGHDDDREIDRVRYVENARVHRELRPPRPMWD